MRGDEGVRFLAAFEALKTATNNDPVQLDACWEEDPRLQAICDTIAEMYRTFLNAEEWAPFAFTPHVPDRATQARRDFEQRWAQSVMDVANRDINWLLGDMLAKLVEGEGQDDEQLPDSSDEVGDAIRSWKAESKEEAGALDHAFHNLAEMYSTDELDCFDWANEAVQVWSRLKASCGLDVSGVLWRRRAIPHILVPSHVSKRYGAGRASLYRRLHDASRAFVFGAPLAALAMQRAILEEVLRELWGAPKGHIREANLPDLQFDARASRLRRLGNEVLHEDPEKMSADQIERSIVENFILLRQLIEIAPAPVRGKVE